MARPPFVVDPAFNCPLNPDELRMLGLLALCWGQIDFIIDEIVSHAHGFDDKQRDEFLTNKQIGTKADMLSKCIPRLPDDLQKAAKDFVEEVGAIKNDRNACFHGVWGWFAPKRKPGLISAVWTKKRHKNPFKASELESLTKKTMNCTWLGMAVVSPLVGWPNEGRKFIWSTGKEAPEWLAKAFGPPQRGRRPQDRRK